MTMGNYGVAFFSTSTNNSSYGSFGKVSELNQYAVGLNCNVDLPLGTYFC